MNTLEKIEMQDEMQEQLDKRDMVLRYFKQVDYNLKPSKEIYTRVKNKIIALSGINAKSEWSYATLCKQAGLNLKEGKALIESLFNKELIHMIKRYDAVLVNQEVEAYYVDKQYTYGTVVPDIAMITHEQAIDYIMSVIEMNVKLRTLNNVDAQIFDKALKSLDITEKDRRDICASFNSRNKQGIFHLLNEVNAKLMAQGASCNLARDFLVLLIKNVKSIDLLGNLLSDASKKNPNVSQKFYAGSCEVNDIAYYMFPI
jgi:hypothetical protein